MRTKHKLPYVLEDPTQLDREFYSGFDELFLVRKARVVANILEDDDLLKRFAEGAGSDEVDRMRHALAAELLFTEFHQFESFFAILVAPFQNRPHWIFLSTYPMGFVKTKAHQFLSSNFRELMDGDLCDRDTFLHRAVYGGCAVECDSQTWNSTMENLSWTISRMAEKYIAGEEYNSYKHGLRIIPASSTLAISVNPNDFSKAFAVHAPHSVTHLKFDEVDEGTRVLVETKGFNPSESLAHIEIMAMILGNIRRWRLGALSGDRGCELTLFSKLDREALLRFSDRKKWAFSR